MPNRRRTTGAWMLRALFALPKLWKYNFSDFRAIVGQGGHIRYFGASAGFRRAARMATTVSARGAAAAWPLWPCWGSVPARPLIRQSSAWRSRIGKPMQCRMATPTRPNQRGAAIAPTLEYAPETERRWALAPCLGPTAARGPLWVPIRTFQFRQEILQQIQSKL
jgi:hypothetical protein